MTVRFNISFMRFEFGDVVEFDGEPEALAELDPYFANHWLERV